MSNVLFAHEWTVGRYACRLTVPAPEPHEVATASVEWLPRHPKRLTDHELVLYRQGRARAMAAFATSLAAPTARGGE